MISNDLLSSDKNMGPEIWKGEANKHDTDLNQESFQNTSMLFQSDNEFLEELNDREAIDCVDIQNENQRDSENISNNKTLMNNGQKYSKIKPFYC